MQGNILNNLLKENEEAEGRDIFTLIVIWLLTYLSRWSLVESYSVR